jgi:hypothetical protein
MVMRCCIWGREEGVIDVEDMVEEDSVWEEEEEDVEDMVFDKMFVREKRRRRSI